MSVASHNRQGFALLMVILLLALLSGVVLQTQISARMTLRAGDESQSRLSLRAAALDAAWGALHNGMKAGSAQLEYQAFDNQLPSGVKTRTTLQGIPRESLPRPLQRPDVPMFGQFFSVTSKSTTGTRSALARGLCCRLPTGDVRILAWLESP